MTQKHADVFLFEGKKSGKVSGGRRRVEWTAGEGGRARVVVIDRSATASNLAGGPTSAVNDNSRRETP